MSGRPDQVTAMAEFINAERAKGTEDERIGWMVSETWPEAHYVDMMAALKLAGTVRDMEVAEIARDILERRRAQRTTD